MEPKPYAYGNNTSGLFGDQNQYEIHVRERAGRWMIWVPVNPFGSRGMMPVDEWGEHDTFEAAENALRVIKGDDVIAAKREAKRFSISGICKEEENA